MENNRAEIISKGLNSMKSIALASANPSMVEESRKDKFTTEESGWFVDTCRAFDTQKWETAVEPEGKRMVIVEQYENREEAEKGHNKWVDAMRENPKRELPDINPF